MKYRSNNLYYINNNSLYRICPSMGTNKILGSNSYYKYFLSNSLYWDRTSTM